MIRKAINIKITSVTDIFRSIYPKLEELESIC